MFAEIHHDSLILRAFLEIPTGALAVCTDSAQPLDSGLFRLEGEVAFDMLPNSPSPRTASSPILRRYSRNGSPLLMIHSKPRLEMGYEAHGLAYGIRLLGHSGIGSLLLVDRVHHVDVEPEDEDSLFLVDDHVNFMGSNPLVGPNHEAWGPRFPDMSLPFDPELTAIVALAAERAGCSVRKAVYAGFHPEHLTDAGKRINHMRKAGASLAGSSLVHEVIVARHMGIRVSALAYPFRRRGELPDAVLAAVLDELSGTS